MARRVVTMVAVEQRVTPWCWWIARPPVPWALLAAGMLPLMMLGLGKSKTGEEVDGA